jgi:hypothetical protein
VLSIRMSGLDRPDVIDVVAVNRHRRVWLIGFDHQRPWDNTGPEFDALKRKIDAYVTFVVSGQLKARFPESEGKPVEIRIHSQSKPPMRIHAYLASIRPWLRQHGISLVVKVRKQESEPLV